MNAAQGAVPVPQVQVLPDRAARRQVFWERLPPAPRPEHVDDRIQDLTHVHRPRTPAAFGRPEDRKSTRLNLQSRQYLVCRLLLVKKKIGSYNPTTNPATVDLKDRKST